MRREGCKGRSRVSRESFSRDSHGEKGVPNCAPNYFTVLLLTT
jgi:hypothetical protein